MPKRSRREQQHLNQRPQRARARTQSGTVGSPDQYKVGFPMNLLQNAKIFYVIGAVIMVGSLFIAFLAQTGSSADKSLPDVEATASAAAALTPTVDPSASPSPDASPTVQRTFTQAEQVLEDGEDYVATIKTAKGDIVLDLFEEDSPRTVNSFVFLAQKGYFNGLTFHRVEPNFVIQGGDPNGDGTGGPGYQTEEDVNDKLNTTGMVSMAKSSGATTVGSQFFINLKDNVALDRDNPTINQKRFYPWAEVTEGMDVAGRIAAGDVITEVVIQVKDDSGELSTVTPAPTATPSANATSNASPSASATTGTQTPTATASTTPAP